MENGIHPKTTEDLLSLIFRFDLRLQEIKSMVDNLDNSHQLLLKTLSGHNQQEDIVSFKEGCAILGIAESTGYSKVSKREIPFMKRGKFIYFSRKMLQEYLHSGRKKTVEELEIEAATFSKHSRTK